MIPPHSFALPRWMPLAVLVAVALPVSAASAVQVNDDDQPLLEAFLGHARHQPQVSTREHFESITEPEKLCWLEFPQMAMCLYAYELTGDTAHLRDFETAFENLRATVKTGPDGFRGWYGQPEASLKDPAKPDAVISEIQTDFRAVTVISRFIELADQAPQDEKLFGTHRAEYLDLMENHLVKKWDASFVDLGPRGAVYRWNMAYQPLIAGLSLPQEKVSMMIEGLLGLYRVTGKDEYARKAIKLGVWFKRCLELSDDCYAWNRWNPAGDWDIHPTEPKKWKSWIGREPKGQWYNSSVYSAALLHAHGFVFDATDMGRFVKTQKTRCWNGDAVNPQFFLVDGKTAAKPGERFLSPDLAPFDPDIFTGTYTGAAQKVRLEKRQIDWWGGVQSGDWLVGKYVRARNASEGGSPTQPYAKYGERFLAKPENAAFAKVLSFEVASPGYQTPPVPPPPAQPAGQ